MAVSWNAKVWAASTCVLYVKFMVTAVIQGCKTYEAGGRPPEDLKMPLARRYKGVNQTYGLAAPVANDAKLHQARATERRWLRIVLNDLEALPMGLLVFGAGVLTEANESVHLGAMLLFTLTRCLHTYAYAHSLQPHRGLLWAFSVASVLVGVGNVVTSGLLAH